MKPKNFKLFIYIFQRNITKAKNFEEKFQRFYTEFLNFFSIFYKKKSIFKFIEFQKKYKEFQYINSYILQYDKGKSKKKIL